MANRKKRIERELAILEKEQAIKTLFTKNKKTQKEGIKPLLELVCSAESDNEFKSYKDAKDLKKIYRQVKSLRMNLPERYLVFSKIFQSEKPVFSELYLYERLANFFFEIEICRSLKSWKLPKSKSDQVIFKSLVCHLFVRYKIPKCIEQDIYNYSFRYHSGLDNLYLRLVFHMIRGKGVHHYEAIKFGLNSKMNFYFHNSPVQFNTRQSIWWARVRGKGVSYSLASKMTDNVYYYNLDWQAWHDDFIFFINRIPNIPQRELNLIFDFINHQKEEEKEVHLPRYEDEITIPALFPDFTFKGRTLASVMRFVEKWNAYVNLFKQIGTTGEFKTSSIQPFKLMFYKNTIRFRQIKNLKGLALEGTQMDHCVGAYGGECVSGNSSIWSVREIFPFGKIKKLLTIEVDEKEKKILQVRGRCNRSAKDHERHWITIWSKKEGLEYLTNAN